MLERDRERNILFRNFQGALQIEVPKTPAVDDEQSPTTQEQPVNVQEPAQDWLKPDKAQDVLTPTNGKKHPAKQTTLAKNGAQKDFQKSKTKESKAGNFWPVVW